jgi:hypothetical protein
MQWGIVRLLVLVGSSFVIASCGADPPVAADADGVSFAVSGGSGAPSNLTLTRVSPHQIDLAWQDNSSGETGFEVQRSAGATAFTRLAGTGANATSHNDANLTAGTEYCYRVRAFRTSGKQTTYSLFSNTACATTPPSAPSNANATPASSTAVDVTWLDNSATEGGFRLERSTSSAGPWAVAAQLAANTTSYRDVGRAGEQTVCYRALAFNSHGDSPPSTADCTTPPAGPTNLNAVATDQSISLTWLDNSSVEDGYDVRRSIDGVTFATVVSLPVNSTTYRDAGPATNATYWYQVQARKDAGFSDVSNVASAQAACVPSGATEDVCDNATDDDCDGLVDAADPDCPRCASYELDCTNGLDEDCDGLRDLDDPDCTPSGCGEACPSGYYCIDDVCVSHCHDGVRNGDESDIDCGGACGASCDTGDRCNGNWDCTSNSCVNRLCQPPIPNDR